MQVTREPLRVRVRGRFGCRRVLVDECCHVFRVEDLYHQIIRERRTNPPGTRGYVDAVVKCGPEWRLAFVWTRNRIWTLGRPSMSALAATAERPGSTCRVCSCVPSAGAVGV
jgi:hypothetical protein